MRNLFKLFAASIIVAIGLLGAVDANAAEKFPQTLYIKQDREKTCTLAAATMMIRARLYLSGYENWSSCTEADARKTGWEEGGGLRWDFGYSIGGNKLTIAHTSVNGMTVAGLKKLLDAHPEGVEIYCRSVPHAVFVTDYEGDTFYCADSASKCSGVRRTLASSWLVVKPGSKLKTQKDVLAGINDYWYIKSYSIKPIKYEGIFKEDGLWKYYSGGVFRDDVTGVVKRTDNNTWWYVKNGVVQFNVTGVVKRADNNTWWYVNGGKVQFGFTGFADNSDGRWRIENGRVNSKYNDIVKDESQWRLYNGGKWQSDATTIARRSNGTWWYVKNGVVRFNVTSVEERTDNGTWWYVNGGKVQFDFTGFADNSNGRWRIENGRVNSKYNDIVKDESQWRLYSGGKWQSDAATVARRSNGTWWFVKDGKVRFGVTGIVKRTDNGTWWYVENGRVQFDKNGSDEITIGDHKFEWTFKGGKLISGYPDETFAFEGDYVISDGKVWYYIENTALYTQDT